MTTKLSESLRELRNGLFPDAESVNALLDQCIAQAEAQEQAGGLSDEVIAQMNAPVNLGDYGDLTDKERTYLPMMGEAIHEAYRAGIRYARDKGYLRPSQAIGEQTPVAWCVAYDGPGPNEGRRVHSNPTMHKPAAEKLAQRTGLALVSLYPSPMSYEARDMAIEALNRLQSYVTLDELPRHYDEVINQALSALRGDQPPTISPKGPQEA